MLVSTAFFNMIFEIIWTILGKKIVLEQGWKKNLVFQNGGNWYIDIEARGNML